MLTLLALAVLGMGLDPKPMTDTMGVSVNELLRLATVSKLGH